MATKPCEHCHVEIDVRGMKAHLRKHDAEAPLPNYHDERSDETVVDIASAIAAAHAAPIATETAGSGHEPAMVVRGAESEDQPRPKEIAKVASRVSLDGRSSQPAAATPSVKPPPLDPITRALGATQYRAGTDNRYDWCREGTAGPRHTFTRLYFRERVLVDIYQSRTKGVEAEVAAKSASIVAHNEARPSDALGYLAVFVGDAPPSYDVCERAKAGEVVGFALPPALVGAR